MKKEIAYLGIITVFLVISGWSYKVQNPVKQAEWLIGTWQNKTNRGNLYETWKKISEDELSGKSYIIRDKDTVIFETLQLLKENNTIVYVPTVKNQNNNLPVRFPLKTSSDSQLIFENPAHDFPQRITYTKVNSDSLVAEISGSKNGQQRKQTFGMKKLR